MKTCDLTSPLNCVNWDTGAIEEKCVRATTESKALFLAPRGTIAFQLEDTGVKRNFEGRNNTWRKVRLLNGVVGYVFGGYLTKAR